MTDNTSEDATARIQALEEQVARLRKENSKLRGTNTTNSAEKDHCNNASQNGGCQKTSFTLPPLPAQECLNRDQVERYSRQLLLAEGFGVPGQLKLLSSSVLVVGAGGIGSTVLMYLGASGIGRISVVDFDNVSAATRTGGFFV